VFVFVFIDQHQTAEPQSLPVLTQQQRQQRQQHRASVDCLEPQSLPGLTQQQLHDASLDQRLLALNELVSYKSIIILFISLLC